MAWVRLDDGYPEHPKVDRVGPLAAWLNVCAWAYCARNLTDGFVPHERVPRLARVSNAKKLAGLLVDAKLWELVPGGYRVHDYLSYNPSRETVLRDRAATARRVAEYRDKHVTTSVGNGVTEGVTNDRTTPVANGVSTSAPYPARTHPELKPENIPDKTPHGVMSESSAEDIERVVFDYYKARVQPRARQFPRKKIGARLKRFSADELRLGIDHFAAHPWWMSHNAQRGAEWFFESDARAEQFLLMEPEPPRPGSEESAEPACECEQLLADLRINRNCNRVCPQHGWLSDGLEPLPALRSRVG